MENNYDVEYLKNSANVALQHVRDIYKISYLSNQLNEQWFINWLDDLNQVSVDEWKPEL